MRKKLGFREHKFMEKSLSTILSHLMSENRITSAELARRTGIGQPVIYRIMTGSTDNPQVLTLKPIAEFFKISIDQLLGISPLSTRALNGFSLHTLSNQLTTIKTIASVFAELLPQLIDGYKKALSDKLIHEEVASDILPLLPINAISLLKNINQLEELLTINNINQDEK